MKERAAPDPATYIGKGAVEEIGAVARGRARELVVFDDELSPAQARNLEKRWGEASASSTARASSSTSSRSTRARARRARRSSSRSSSTCCRGWRADTGTSRGLRRRHRGARGAGEQKLELDRRKIRDRIARLRRDLEKIETAREVAAARPARTASRSRSPATRTPGKTTLFNRLTRRRGYAADRLFATLDCARGSRRLGGAARRHLPRHGRLRPQAAARRSSPRSARRSPRSATPTSCCTCSTRPRRGWTRSGAWRSEVLAELGVSEENGSWRSGTSVTCRARFGPAGAVRVSAATGAGIGDLERAIVRRARPEPARMPPRASRTRTAAPSRRPAPAAA